MKAVICAAAILVVAGCAGMAPIADVVEAPVPSSRILGRADVARAIERGCRYLGWQVFAEGPGLFSARLELRSHVAEVEIEHDAASYSIRYRESENLDAADGAIHDAYNRWVRKLHRAIRQELELL